MPRNRTNKTDNVMNTKTDGISSGLVAVAIGLFWKSDGEETLQWPVLRSADELVSELEMYTPDDRAKMVTDGLVRLSDAEAIISKQSAALKLAREALEIAEDTYSAHWRDGMPIIDLELCAALAAINEVLGE